MAGELVPLVLIPRYTTYVGAGTYTTIGMDVTQYQTAIVNVWGGLRIGTSPTFDVTFEESTDQDSWSVCSGTTANDDPGVNTEKQYSATLSKRWFRLKVTTGGTNAATTCWAVGFLEERLS